MKHSLQALTQNYLFLITLILISSTLSYTIVRYPFNASISLKILNKYFRRLRKKLTRILIFVLYWQLSYIVFFLSSIVIAFVTQSFINIIYTEYNETSYCSTRWFCRNYPQLCCREIQTYIWPIQSGFNQLLLSVFAFTFTIVNY